MVTFHGRILVARCNLNAPSGIMMQTNCKQQLIVYELHWDVTDCWWFSELFLQS